MLLQRLYSLAWTPTNLVRNFSSRKNFVEFDYTTKRRGFAPKYLMQGPLPRLVDENSHVQQTFIKRKPLWHHREAYFGQNDYIDILGHDNIHPTRVLDRMPFWLKGFGGNEIALIQRKRQAHPHWAWSKPAKFEKMKKRLHWLYQRMNRKQEPPPIAQY